MALNKDGWEADEAVTETVLDGRQSYPDLADDERRWVIADLTDRGYTVAEIAGALGCSIRHVKRLRADLSTRVMIGLARERRNAAEAMEVARSAVERSRRVA